MKIKMLASYAGPDYILAPGERRGFPRDQAVRLIEAGLAVPVIEANPSKAIKRPAPETRQ